MYTESTVTNYYSECTVCVPRSRAGLPAGAHEDPVCAEARCTATATAASAQAPGAGRPAWAPPGGGFFSFSPFSIKRKSYTTYTAARLHGPLHVCDMRYVVRSGQSSAQQRTHSVVISRQVDSALARGIRHLKERL